MTVAEWQVLFDERYANPVDDTQDCEVLSKSTGVDQEYYFLAYCIDGLVSMWRASGDNTYLDTTLELIDNTVQDAVLQSDGYRRWPGPADNGGFSYPLWESYYWRQVATLLRVMHHNPGLLASGDYQSSYDSLLAFTKKHIWEKWVAGGLGNLYRSNTHMASHWARIGMELFQITGEDEYKTVFDNISHGTMYNRPSNLREQFEPNPDHPAAWVWSSTWDAEPTEATQDTSHAGAIISFINEAEDQNMYWSSDDVNALIATLLEVVWRPDLDGAYAKIVDGTSDGDPYGLPGGLGGRLHEWLHLGRHSTLIQERIETIYIDPARRNIRYFGCEPMGIGALNARILADGAPVY